MSQVEDKDVIDWIKKKKYSQLLFLDDCWHSSDNESYLGFYYFIRHFKEKDVGVVFELIRNRFNDESSAYCYLGETAQKIFSSRFEGHVSAGFYRKAIALNDKNSAAHWGLYWVSRDVSSLLKSLKINHESGNNKALNQNIRNMYLSADNTAQFSPEDWLLIRNVLQDYSEDCHNHEDLLLLAYYHISQNGEPDDTLELMNASLALIESSTRSIDKEVLKLYYDGMKIDENKVLEKVRYSDVDCFFPDDHKQIYLVWKKEFEKGNPNPTRAAIIVTAFRAEQYADVIAYYEEAPEGDLSRFHHVDSQLYYLLSQMSLGLPPCDAALGYIRGNQRQASHYDNSMALIQAVEFKLKMKKLERESVTPNHLNVDLEYWGSYKDAVAILKKPKLLKHFIHDQLDSELKAFKCKWYKNSDQVELTTLKAKSLNESMSHDDDMRLCGLAMRGGELELAEARLLEFHEKNSPTMISYNCMGVCYQKKGDLNAAFKQYKLALDLMYKTGEYAYIIISNYIECAKLLSDDILPDDEFNKLKSDFNVNLISQYKWHTFTGEHRNRLFKYSPFNINTIDAITNQYFYLAGKGQLNDPLELSILNEVSADHIIDTNYRICSFSNNANSMLMWSHYAQEHQGVMVEYWFGGEFPKGTGICGITYTDEKTREKEKNIYRFDQYLLTKNKAWKYEKEVRLFSNQFDKVSYETFDYPDVDQSKINAQIRSITLGCNFPEDKKKLITNMITSMNDKKASYEKKIILREAYFSDEDIFSLKYRNIDID